MKKKCKIWIAVMIFFLLYAAVPVGIHAETVWNRVTLAKQERYDPRYYKSVFQDFAQNRASRLSEEGLEDSLVAALSDLEGKIDVSRYGLSAEEFKTAYFQILNGHPELFFVKMGYSYSSANGTVAFVMPAYTIKDKQQIRKLQNQVELAAHEAVSLVSEEMEDYEKALVVHDWLVNYCEYDYSPYLNGQVPEESHTAYGVFVNRKAVCDGYAKAYMYIMQQKLGIACGIVSSGSMNHAWNLIRIGTEFYHVDATWDDPVWDCIGRVSHTYFLLSDDTIENGRNTPHTGWASDVKAEDSSYENGHWADSESGIVYYGGNWYFVDNTDRKLKMTDNILNGSETVCHTFGRWPAAGGSYWRDAYSYLSRYRNKLIFNGPDEIYCMPFKTGRVQTLYRPSGISSGTHIYGFRLNGDTMEYALQETPVLQNAQDAFIHTAPLPGEKLAGEIVIRGDVRYGGTLTASVTPEMGSAGTVYYQWYSGGRILAGETGGTYQLKGSDIGNIITVKVIHEEYIGELITSTAAVLKAIPTEPAALPVLKGRQDEKLAAVSLPAGYAWKMPDTVMEEAGKRQYTVIYTPDASLYETIEFEVFVDVSARPACQEHDWDAGVEIVGPSCAVEGRIEYTCRKCGAVRAQQLPATGIHSWDNGTVVKEALCGEAGEKRHSCLVCGTEKTEKLPATGLHNWDNGKTLKEATCGETGEKRHSCLVCGAEKTEKLPATGLHNWDNGKTLKEAACGEAGEKEYTCTMCGSVKKEAVPAVGAHRWDDGRIVSAASCTRDGRKQYACTLCQMTREETIAATGHQHTQIRGERKATAKTAGYTGDTYCTDCGARLAYGVEVAFSAHVPDKGEILKSGSLYYQVIKPGEKNGTVSVYKAAGNQKEIRVLPSVLIGGIRYKVVSVAAKAFKNNKKVTRVVLGSQISSIGKEAFWGCRNLKKITVKSVKLKSVGKDAFKGINKKAVVWCPARKWKTYQKLFSKKAGYQAGMKIMK